MFGFKKNVETKIEPEFTDYRDEAQTPSQSLADILGAKENDTNITAGVDAILDDTADISEESEIIGSDKIDFNMIDDAEAPVDLGSYEDSVEGEVSAYEEMPEYLRTTSSETFANQEIDSITDDNVVSAQNNNGGVVYQQQEQDAELVADVSQVSYPAEEQEMSAVLPADENLDDSTSGIDDITEPDGITAVDDILAAEDDADLSLDDILGSNTEVYSVDDILQDNAAEKKHEADFEESSITEPAAENFALPEVTSAFADEPDTVAEPAEESPITEPAAENFALPEVTSAFADEPDTVTEPAEESPITEPAAEMSTFNMQSVSEDIHINASQVSWVLVDLSALSESPRVINRNSGFVTWNGDKYQRDIRVDIEAYEEADKWTLTLMNEFSVPLGDVNSEMIIEKDSEVVRYAGLIHNGEEKLKIFNQRSYKFITPRDDFFTVQGNVICGHVDSSFSLNITDYREISLADKLNRYIRFSKPSSGFITGPDGVKAFFANTAGIALVCPSELPEPEVFEYMPSLKDFDNKSFFVFDEESEMQEVIANSKKKNLVINTGASLYGWNVRFDNETYMSLRDALEYQAKYKQLPTPNGEIIHGSRILKFFGIETLKARVKIVYYSYGRI